MDMAALGFIAGGLGTAVFAGGVFFYLHAKKLLRHMGAQSEEMRQRMYELAILKEVGDRIGYSLNIQKIADVIIGSLNQFMKYSVASYMLLEPERIVFKVDIGEPVSHRFINEVKERMRLSLAAILDRDLGSIPIEETITGTLPSDTTSSTVESFFNIPLVIAGSAVGVLTVASTKNGLYKEKEMTMLYKIVGQASQAITRLEEVVTLERGKLQAMVESMEDGVLMTDQNFRVVVANSSLKESVNVPEGRDLTLFDIIDACGGTVDIKGRLEESIKLDRTFVAGEVNLMGSIYQIFIFPVKSRASKSLGILGGGIIFHNITRERASEKLRDDFTSMMVHELRSPLDSIRKIGELLRTPAIRDDKNAYDEYMGMVSQSATNMLDLVNDLLDVAKLEAGKFQIAPREASIRKIIEERVKFFDTQARNATLVLSVGFDDHVPEMLSFDPLRVGQVLSNLLSNAIKFSAPGGSVVTQALFHTKGVPIEEEMSRAGFRWVVTDALKVLNNHDTCVVIAVTDTGSGIAKENIARLFNKFEQFSVSATGGDRKGTGLGLVIVRGIIEAHGGVAGVSSEEGKGSTFYVTLPVTPSAS